MPGTAHEGFRGAEMSDRDLQSQLLDFLSY